MKHQNFLSNENNKNILKEEITKYSQLKINTMEIKEILFQLLFNLEKLSYDKSIDISIERFKEIIKCEFCKKVNGNYKGIKFIPTNCDILKKEIELDGIDYEGITYLIPEPDFFCKYFELDKDRFQYDTNKIIDFEKDIFKNILDD